MSFRHPSRKLTAALVASCLAFVAAPAVAPAAVESAPIAHGVQNGVAAMVDLATESDPAVLTRRINR
jgi:hypothetical protein